MDVVKPLDCQYVVENDLVIGYLDGRLSDEEAEAFEKHYFECERCWAEVKAGEEIRAAGQRTRGAAGPAPRETSNVRRGPWARWRVLTLAAAVAAAAVGAVLLVRSVGRSPVDSVVAAAGSKRTLEARLAVSERHVSPEQITRAPIVGSWRLGKAREDAEKAAARRPSAETLRAAGIAQLLTGDFVAASSTLQRAAEAYPRDPEVLNDLGVARFVGFSSAQDARELEAAYEAVSRALLLNPRLPSAQFNKALFAERLGYSDAARREWRRYLELDSTSDWAREATEHLKEHDSGSRLWPDERQHLFEAAKDGDEVVVAEILKRHPESSRLYVEDTLLPEWARENIHSASHLAAARTIARVLHARIADSFLHDALETIDAAAEHQPRISKDLRRAHRLYGDARALDENGKDAALVTSLFHEASLLFARSRSPFRDLATLREAESAFDQNDLTRSLELLRSTTQDGREEYPDLVARLSWWTGLVQVGRGHPLEALEAYRVALTTLERLGDRERIGFMHTLISEAHQDLGELPEASEHRLLSLAALQASLNPKRRYVALSDAGDAAKEQRFKELARLAYLEAFEEARRIDRPEFMTHALLNVARVDREDGNVTGALSRVRSAVALCDRIGDQPMRTRMRAEADIAEGELSTTPSDSIDGFSRAADFFRGRGDLARLSEVYLGRGRAYRAANAPERAYADFLAGVEALDTERDRLPRSHDARISVLEHGQEIFDEAIGAAAAEGRVEQAASIIEKARARSLFEAFSRTIPERLTGQPDLLDRVYPRPLEARAICAMIPADTVVAEYSVLADRLLILVYRHTAVRLLTVHVPSGRLDQLAQQSGERLRSPTAAGRDSLVQLHRLLVEPLAGELATTGTLIVVPDKCLHRVPFSALRNGATGRYLVEDVPVGISPSVSVFIRASARHRELAHVGKDTVLLVEDPALHPSLRTRLPVLPGARAEVSEIESLYGNVISLRGTSATPTNFRAAAASASIVHFAGHAMVEGSSMLSSLVLAPSSEPSDLGLLYAHEISSMRLERTRLVILGACETARGATRGAEGVMSVARAFLAAGVPSVLGTLSQVDDRSASALLVDFHRYLASGDSPLMALRRAQLDRLRAGQGPESWASFELIGGV